MRNVMEKTVIILRGPAGSGKSTIANLLKNRFGGQWVHIDVDYFKHLISEDSSAERTNIAHQTANFLLEQLMQNDFSIIIEEIFRDGYYQEVKNLVTGYRYEVHTIFLKADEDILIDRDKQRPHKNKGEEIIRELNAQIQPGEGELVIDTSGKSPEEIAGLVEDSI